MSLISSAAFAADDWQIIKVSGHDYLSVDNISKFYSLPAEVVPAGKKIQLETVKNPLEFVSGSRETMINGARSWLCFPVIEHSGKFLVSRIDVAKRLSPSFAPIAFQTSPGSKLSFSILAMEVTTKARSAVMVMKRTLRWMSRGSCGLCSRQKGCA